MLAVVAVPMATLALLVVSVTVTRLLASDTPARVMQPPATPVMIFVAGLGATVSSVIAMTAVALLPAASVSVAVSEMAPSASPVGEYVH